MEYSDRGSIIMEKGLLKYKETEVQGKQSCLSNNTRLKERGTRPAIYLAIIRYGVMFSVRGWVTNLNDEIILLPTFFFLLSAI